METEFRPRKKLIPEKRKTVKLEMGSMRDENRYDAFRRNPRSMIRRLSRAASFKNACKFIAKFDLSFIVSSLFFGFARNT